MTSANLIAITSVLNIGTYHQLQVLSDAPDQIC